MEQFSNPACESSRKAQKYTVYFILPKYDKIEIFFTVFYNATFTMEKIVSMWRQEKFSQQHAEQKIENLFTWSVANSFFLPHIDLLCLADVVVG